MQHEVNMACPGSHKLGKVRDLLPFSEFSTRIDWFCHVVLLLESKVDGERAHQSRNVIELDEFSLAIYKDTAANHYTER